MNRTNVVFVVIVAILLLDIGNAQTKSAPLQASPATPCTATGRYLLFTGEHFATSDAGGVTLKDILRIDTLTGETSQWMNGESGGKFNSYWKKVDPK